MAIIPPDNDQSKLLFDSYPLVIIPELAEAIGLNEAIVLQQLHYWIMMNRKAGRNYHEGRYWTYNTFENWENQFPFWSNKTIKRIFKNLEKQDLIITGNFNKLKIDRTKWYSINHETLKTLSMTPLGQNDPMHRVKMTQPLPETSIQKLSKDKVKGLPSKKRKETSPISFDDFKTRIQEEITDDEEQAVLNLMEEFITYYKHWRGKEHPPLKLRTWVNILKTLPFIQDERGVDILERGDFEDVVRFFPDMFKKHFETDYQPGCDYNLPHFNQNNIKLHRWYEVQHSGGEENNVDLSWDYDSFREE